MVKGVEGRIKWIKIERVEGKIKWFKIEGKVVKVFEIYEKRSRVMGNKISIKICERSYKEFLIS